VPNFVDIHSHVLYGLDDGPPTVAESVAMLELARDAGTTDIVATPHADTQYTFDPAVRDARIAELSARVPGITIHRGCDFRLEVCNIHDAIANPTKYTINHKSYLLVEFPHMTVFPNAGAIFAQLLDARMTPIITHPERNAYLQEHPETLTRFVEAGCFAQVTAASCTGKFGKRVQQAAMDLLARGVVHFIASDAHDTINRTPDMRAAYALLSKQWGESRVRPLFVDNPRAVLQGRDVDTSIDFPRATRKKWWEIWR
jgi:protein-tyrosine phosphatase